MFEGCCGKNVYQRFISASDVFLVRRKYGLLQPLVIASLTLPDKLILRFINGNQDHVMSLRF